MEELKIEHKQIAYGNNDPNIRLNPDSIHHFI